MLKRSTKLAFVAGKYNHPTRPIIKKWVGAITSCIDYACIYSYSSATSRDAAGFELLKPSGKIRTIASCIANCVRWPLQSIYWLCPKNNVPLKEKISAWARSAPVIINNPQIIHLINPYLYPGIILFSHNFQFHRESPSHKYCCRLK